jgi:hypothetical protein
MRHNDITLPESVANLLHLVDDGVHLRKNRNPCNNLGNIPSSSAMAEEATLQ